MNEVQNYSVNMSNVLIRASQPMTLSERRFLYLCISKIDSSEKHDGMFTISARDYAITFKVKLDESYKVLGSVIRTLYERSIEFHTDDNEEACRWIYRRTYNKGTGTCTVWFSPNLMPYLCELRANFTQVKLKLLSGLNSVYAQRLYELLVRFKSKKVYLTTIEDFRFAMSVPDVYLYGNIKQTCILPALLEIREKLHLDIQLTEVKKLRKVVALQFRW